MIGPDATGAGWVYEYLIVDHNHRYSLADLRSLQDWFLRYQIETVPGVAEVASIGGFVRQYQVRLDPDKLRAFNIPLSTVIERVRDSTNEVGGRLLEFQGAEYMVRGLGYLRSLSDLETVPVGAKNGTPVLVRDLGTVSFGPDIRRGVAEWNGDGEAVGGIVVMRYGLNALNVISGVKKKLAEISGSLPPGVEIVSGYDRSGLIQASIDTLERVLIEEAVIVSLVIIIFLFHFRSALIPILTLPIAVIASFIPMYYLQVSSNIMSLGGLALAIGVLVDAAIVMVENGYRQLSEAQYSSQDDKFGPRSISPRERRRILLDAAKQVGPALFFSLLIIVVSFLPVFLLEAQEGRMFRPLAWTKTLAVGFSSLLAITLVPPLMLLFIRGRLRPESSNPVSRVTQALYLPVLRLCLRFPKTTVLLNLVFLGLTAPLALKLGSQFMPPLFEGASLYMPTALPGISIGQATQLLQEQDRILRGPEVATVFALHRGPTARPTTLPSTCRHGDAEIPRRVAGDDPHDKPEPGWHRGRRQTSMRAPSTSRKDINVDVNRAEAARYGLTVGDVQRAITSGIGGENIAENIEGRERYPISIRYAPDFRDHIQKLERVVIATPSNAQVPLGELAKISFSKGPAMIRDEDAALTGYVYLDLNTRDYGGFVSRADRLLQEKLQFAGRLQPEVVGRI